MEPIREKLASFYLGLEYDLAQGNALEKPVVYDARDLTTHGVIVGMTGSGKTGLGVILLEEAALDGVPSIVIDPKGDMTNLLLTFPNLRPDEFEPWVNPDDARRREMEVPAFAAATAEQWRNGLESTGQGAERIRRLRESAEFCIYTPGRSSGRPISIINSFKAPELSWEEDAETIRDKLGSTVSALLALVGIDADPLRSREHILLSNIFENAWRAAEDLDLAQLIRRIQKPPFSQLGVFPVDTFYPERDRMQLAMLLNGLIASPTFADWLQGDPLDIGGLLYGPGGKPKVSIVYVAHLSDQERQFFLTLLLEQVVSWVRMQSGTTSLRALLYMDEVFGYLPPHPGNPPTKKPILTLLKQARAFGLGLVLATQNPVDLDYKALSNAGTWFIGRMQTERDKLRLLDGLEGVAAGSKGPTRAEFDRTISALRTRVFLLHNVHQGNPVVMSTRWAMSYLRGPLTLPQVRQLLASQPQPRTTSAPTAPAVSAPVPAPAAPGPAAAPSYAHVPPQLPAEVKQVYLPVQTRFEDALVGWARERNVSMRSAASPEGRLVYEAGLVGLTEIYYSHTQSRQTFTEEPAFLAQVGREQVDWSQARVQLEAHDLDRMPERGALFGELPHGLGSARDVAAQRKRFEDYVVFSAVRSLRHHPTLRLYSAPDETEADFLRRCRQAAEAARDEEIKKVQARFATRLGQLEARKTREEANRDKYKDTHGARKMEELASGFETLVGLATGRRSSTRLTSASTRRRMTAQAKARVREAEAAIKDVEAQIKSLTEEEKREIETLTARWQGLVEGVQEVPVRPRRSDVRVNLFGVAWIPHWEVEFAGQTLSLPAYRVQRAT